MYKKANINANEYKMEEKCYNLAHSDFNIKYRVLFILFVLYFCLLNYFKI